MRIRLAAEGVRRAGEKLRLGGDLHMHLHADDDFPVAGRAFDQLRFLVRRCIHRDFYPGRDVWVTRFTGPLQAGPGRWARGHGPLTLPKVRAEYPRRAFALDNARISEFN